MKPLRLLFFHILERLRVPNVELFLVLGQALLFQIIVYQEILTNSIQKIGNFQMMPQKMQAEIFYYSKISKMLLVIQ